ncbi:ATP-binding protein [Anaeromicropila herbilytica]|uniref:NB-ARC domain-containing protein n=1 Tax=Anaeromicropila herbilytica TaxID=2785025 RepID=A0A7R7EPN7_9FIRM|nr:NB-ARC domain-containing protein [Anaeromicropila herbilytica]BCN32724.1 hypothetical protein bsdtb5_40190 [Anaeromicropila herbilytica]
MYLSNEETVKLHSAVKYFEVGFRSYVSEKIIESFEDEKKLHESIEMQRDKHIKNSMIFNGKIQGFLDKFKKERDTKKIYNLLQEAYDMYKAQTKCDIKEEKAEAFLLISDIYSITYIFYADIFNGLLQDFPNALEYMYFSEKYRVVRNNLCHPAAKISEESCKDVIRYIRKIVLILEDKYFWFESKDNLISQLDDILVISNSKVLESHNLDSLPKNVGHFVCRENEITTLNKYIMGNEIGLGRMKYILVSGYGGMGKTTLVTEAILRLIKEYVDKMFAEDRWFDFILFFSAKEEKLDFDYVTKNLKLCNLKKQITTLVELKSEIKQYLGTDNLATMRKKGLIVIDNFETINDTEKQKIDNYILYESADSIQYIVTSRTEQRINTNCKLHLEEIKEDGIEFVKEYIDVNGLKIDLNDSDIGRLVFSCKGNTLVLVLALHRMDQGVFLKTIENELNSVNSQTTQYIVNFMSKNAFDDIYNGEKFNKQAIDTIIKILVMYDEPIDIYSISRLGKLDSIEVEKVILALVDSLILEIKNEIISINEFAKSYLLIEFKPNEFEYNELKDLIWNYKFEMDGEKKHLESMKHSNKHISDILEDWKPLNVVDELAIMNAFNLYSKLNVAQTIKYGIKNFDLKEIKTRFEQIEMTSKHPYIYFQKTRILNALLLAEMSDKERENILRAIKASYENCLLSIDLQYSNIRGTVSYANTLREYGRFLQYENKDSKKASSNLEEGKRIYEKLGLNQNKYYYFCIFDLANAYYQLFIDTASDLYKKYSIEYTKIVANSKHNDIHSIRTKAKALLRERFI